MYVAAIPNRSSPPAILLRESFREGGKVKNRTLANLTHWPKDKVDALRRICKGERLVTVEEAFSIEASLPHGHVRAILATIRNTGLDRIIASKRSRARDLVLALIAERLLHGSSKLAATRLWHTTTLAEELAVQDADEEEAYGVLDWLLSKQPVIEKKLAARHLSEAAPVLYDVSSSYYEGRTCLLAKFGHNRDKKKGKTIIVYGVLTDDLGRPIAVEVYEGNTGDPTTVPDQADKLRARFGLSRVILVGDRGMITKTTIKQLTEHPGLGWISALRSSAIRELMDQGTLQHSIFDERNLAEIESDAFPDERLVACYNPFLADERKRKRRELLAGTEQALEKIAREAARRTKKPLDKAEIGKKVGRVLYQYKMAKHFKVAIKDSHLSWTRLKDRIQREEELDGIYVIRTTEPKGQLSPEDTVRQYKNLAKVERVFRTLKGLDLRIRPIRHRTEDHVRAHIFLCLLAYYVAWHMRKALAPLLFDDEDLEAHRKVRNPVAPAESSPSAKAKKKSRRTVHGHPVHSFNTLLAALGTQCRHQCVLKSDPDTPPLTQLTKASPLQSQAFKLLGIKGSQ